MAELWTEKYRPKSSTTFSGPEYLKTLLSSSKLRGHPHLLLYGPPGTGKTTFAHLLANEKLELNASDERGIGVIRGKIKAYASTIVKDKTVILDECDSLTDDAQQCLRRVLEDYTQTRFIFITNYASRIIAPLKSRLLKIRFELRSNDILESIRRSEGLSFDAAFYCRLFDLCRGDLRRSINVLQGYAPLRGCELEDVIGLVPEEWVNKFWGMDEPGIDEFVREFMRNSYSALQLIHQLEPKVGCEKFKALFMHELSILEGKCVLGCSDELVLRSLCQRRFSIMRE